MSDWDKFSIEAVVRQILGAKSKRNAHFGRPYLTAYQIAITIAERHRNTYVAIGRRIGGKGKGPEQSLARYIAKQLSDRIKDGRISDIEGAFLSGDHLTKLVYQSSEGEVEPSTGSSHVSMFRLNNISQEATHQHTHAIEEPR